MTTAPESGTAGSATIESGRAESGESAGARVRHREVTWEDPLVSAALAGDLSGVDFLRAIMAGHIPPAPIAVLLGMSIVQADPGQITGPDGTLYAHGTTTCLVLTP